MYCKRGNFCMGVIVAFFALLRENYPHAKIKPLCLYEGNSSSTVKITTTWNVLPTYSRTFPPAKITTFTVYLYRPPVRAVLPWSDQALPHCGHNRQCYHSWYPLPSPSPPGDQCIYTDLLFMQSFHDLIKLCLTAGITGNVTTPGTPLPCNPTPSPPLPQGLSIPIQTSCSCSPSMIWSSSASLRA